MTRRGMQERAGRVKALARSPDALARSPDALRRRAKRKDPTDGAIPHVLYTPYPDEADTVIAGSTSSTSSANVHAPTVAAPAPRAPTAAAPTTPRTPRPTHPRRVDGAKKGQATEDQALIAAAEAKVAQVQHEMEKATAEARRRAAQLERELGAASDVRDVCKGELQEAVQAAEHAKAASEGRAAELARANALSVTAAEERSSTALREEHSQRLTAGLQAEEARQRAAQLELELGAASDARDACKRELQEALQAAEHAKAASEGRAAELARANALSVTAAEERDTATAKAHASESNASACESQLREAAAAHQASSTALREEHSQRLTALREELRVEAAAAQQRCVHEATVKDQELAQSAARLVEAEAETVRRVDAAKTTALAEATKLTASAAAAAEAMSLANQAKLTLAQTRAKTAETEAIRASEAILVLDEKYKKLLGEVNVEAQILYYDNTEHDVDVASVAGGLATDTTVAQFGRVLVALREKSADAMRRVTAALRKKCHLIRTYGSNTEVSIPTMSFEHTASGMREMRKLARTLHGELLALTHTYTDAKAVSASVFLRMTPDDVNQLLRPKSAPMSEHEMQWETQSKRFDAIQELLPANERAAPRTKPARPITPEDAQDMAVLVYIMLTGDLDACAMHMRAGSSSHTKKGAGSSSHTKKASELIRYEQRIAGAPDRNPSHTEFLAAQMLTMKDNEFSARLLEKRQVERYKEHVGNNEACKEEVDFARFMLWSRSTAIRPFVECEKYSADQKVAATRLLPLNAEMQKSISEAESADQKVAVAYAIMLAIAESKSKRAYFVDAFVDSAAFASAKHADVLAVALALTGD
jgi:hypothetical protein